MEGGAATVEAHEREDAGRVRAWASAHPAAVFMSIVVAIGIILVAIYGLREVAQTGLIGLSTGSYVAMGAVGLTLVYGILKLTNFAHGDLLTFGAYMAFVVSVSWDGPFLLGVLAAVVMTALLGVLFELLMWGPMRAKGAGFLQLVLMSIGLAFVIRSTIQFIAGGDPVFLDDISRNAASSPLDFMGIDLRLRNVLWISLATGIVVLLAVGAILQYTMLGKKMRALSDSIDLAETTGINTERVVLITWLFAGALAGLGGVMVGMVSQVKPEVGFELLLPIFAAVVLGGIGNPFGALAAGLTLGVLIEWSTIPISPNWKFGIGFVVLIIALVIRPQGIFGKARAV